MTMDIFKGIGDTLKCMSKTKKDGAGLGSENGGGALIPQKLVGYKEPKKVSKIKKVKKGKREQDKYLSDLESGKTIAIKKPSSLKNDMSKIAKAFIVVRKTGMEETIGEFKKGNLKSGSGKKVTNRKQAIAIGMNEADKSLFGSLGVKLVSNKKNK